MGAGWERLAGMRKTIDEPTPKAINESTHDEACDCFTRLDSVKDGSIETKYLVSSPKYRVGDFGETTAHDSTKEKRFRS